MLCGDRRETAAARDRPTGSRCGRALSSAGLCQAQHSSSVCTHKLKLKTAMLGQTLRTCCCDRAPHFLHIVKVVFDGRPVGRRLDDLARRGVWVGAEEVLAAVVFLDDHDADQAACLCVARRQVDRPVRGRNVLMVLVAI